MLIQIDKTRHINPEKVVTMEIVHSNGTDSYLKIFLDTGQEYNIKDTSHCLDGTDIYKLQKEIIDAVNMPIIGKLETK